MKSIPWRGYTSSPNGLLHNFSTYVSTGTEELMYLVEDGLIDSIPLTHPEFISGLYSPKGTVTVSDGRGTSKELVLGASDSMAMANDGTFAWKGGPHIFRAKSPTSITAVAFLDSPAPGFDESENAQFTSRMDLRGIDASGQVYFTARVTGATFTNQNVIYRTGIDSSALTLLYAPSEHTLPGYESSTGPNFEADDVFPLDDGTVILRAGGNGSYTGFWKIHPNGLIDLAKVFFESTPTDTDLGSVGFRSMRVDFSDFAASDDGAIFFTADVRFGANGTNQEGVWLIDPEDNSIKTIARAPLDGLFGDAPGTDETYFSFSHITADGEGHVAFMSELSNGKQGLFATDLNGEVIAIAIEGDPLDGSIIETIHFSQDHAGAELSDSQGAAGLNDLGQIVFTAELENGTTAIVKSSYETEVLPIGTTFIWDGGAGTDNWHTVVDGRSNWTDEFGTPWGKAPGTEGNEKVEIGSGFVVKQTQSVSIKQITLEASTLEISADLSFADFIEAAGDSVIDLQSGTLDSESGYIDTTGLVTKSTSGTSRMEVDRFNITGNSLRVESGTLNFKNTFSYFENAPIVVEDSTFIIDDNVTAFRGTSVSLSAEFGTLDIRTFSLSIEADATINALDESALIKLGKEVDNPDADIELRSGNATDARTISFIGNGSFELRQNIDFANGDSFINNHSGPFDTGLILNINGAEYLLVPAGVTFENNGYLKIVKGGLSSGKTSSSNTIINKATIDILGAENPAYLSFDCINEGTINQFGNAEFLAPLVNKAKSVYNMFGATLRDGDLGNDLDFVDLAFEAESMLIAHEGNNTIQTKDQNELANEGLSEPTYFANRSPRTPSIEIRGSASLELIDARIEQFVIVHVVDDSSQFILRGAIYKGLDIVGKGRSQFAGRILNIRTLNFSRGYLQIQNKQVEFDNVAFDSTELRSPVVLGQFESGSENPPLYPFAQTAFFQNTIIEPFSPLVIQSNVTATIEKELLLGDRLSNFGKVVLKANIGRLEKSASDPEFDNTGYEDEESFGVLSVPDNVGEEIVVHAEYQAGKYSTVVVGENSSLILADLSSDVYSRVNNMGNLDLGYWETGNGGSITLGNGFWPHPDPVTEINTVESDAALYLRTAPEGGHSINGFPTRSSDLINKGLITIENSHLTFAEGKSFVNQLTLILIDSNITFGGGGQFVNQGSFLPLGSSKVIGNIQSIRNEVQGVIQLAGNLNVEGNVTTDGVISLGASPGSGLITGDLTLLPGSEMRVEFAGKEPGTEFDFLEVGGTVELDGELTLSLIDEYVPESSDAFLFLKADSLSGSFDQVDQTQMGRQRRFDISTGSEGLVATATSISIGSYAEWRSIFFNEDDAANDAVSGPLADPDADGLSNLDEYATGGLPNTFTSVPYQFFADGTDLFEARLTWAKNVADFDWVLEYSIDLMSWLPLANTIDTTVELPDTYEYTLVPEVLSEASTRFYRFRISETP